MPGRHGGDGDDAALKARVAQMEYEMAALRVERDRLRADLDEAEQHIRAQDEVDRILAMGLPPAADGSTGPLPATRVPRASSHRVPKEQRWLKVVTAFAPLAFLGRHLAKGHARKMGFMAMAAVSVPAAAVGVIHIGDATHYAPAPPPAPVAVTVPAVRVSAPSLAAASRPRHHHHVSVPVSVPPSATVRPRPSSSPSPSPSAPQITVPARVDMGVYLSTQVTIGNPQDQAVPWTVTCSQGASVTPAQGVLEPGQQGVELQVSIAPADGASSAVCTFQPGGERTLVTWDGAGSPSGTAG